MIDTSSLYPQPPQPVNPLESANTLVGIRNALTQNQLLQAELPIKAQQLQQEQLQNQLTLGGIKTGQIIAKNTVNGKTNWLGVQGDAAKDPDTSPEPVFSKIQSLVNNQLQATPAGLSSSGAPQTASLQNVNQTLGGGPTQDRIDMAHAHAADMQQSLTDLINLPDDQLTTRKLMTAGVDMIGKHATSNGALGHNATDVASMLADPGFPASDAKPQDIRKYLVSKLNQVSANQAQLTTKFGPPSSQNNTGIVSGTPVAGPTMQTGLAPGAAEDQATRYKHYSDVQTAANTVPQENAALNNVLNLSKSGAETGTMVGQMYSALSKTGIVPQGIEDAGSQLALIKSHAAQLATSGGMPGSDARLEALENAKITDKDLPEVIQNMVPYLLAVNQGKVAQANYYKKVAGNGLNPSQVADAQNNWVNHYDPRIIEMQNLQSNPAELKKYISGLSKEDKAGLLQKYSDSKKLGLLGQ